MSGASKSLWGVLIFGAITLLAHGDVLIATDGERFVGTVITETTSNVVFESELAGRLIFPQSKIHELRRMPPAAITNAITNSVTVTNTIKTNTISWTPPGVGHDGS